MNVTSLQRRQRADAVYEFILCAAELLASDDESRRRHLEGHLLAILPGVRETPIFKIFVIRNPALRAMLDDDNEPLPNFTNHQPAYPVY